jgi:hypothetical protein
MMLARVRIEVGAGGIDNDLAQETGGDELMQCVIDGRQRYLDVRCERLLMQSLRGDMPVAVLKQQPRQREALAGGTQIGAAQEINNAAERSQRNHR